MAPSQLDQKEMEDQKTDNPALSKVIEKNIRTIINLRTKATKERSLQSRIADVWSDTPQAQFLRSILDDGAGVLLKGMHSCMWVPLAVRGRIIGGVGVAETTKNYFTAHHADLALSVANQAAITMINAELYGHAQELAVLEERQRLARRSRAVLLSTRRFLKTSCIGWLDSFS